MTAHLLTRVPPQTGQQRQPTLNEQSLARLTHQAPGPSVSEAAPASCPPGPVTMSLGEFPAARTSSPTPATSASKRGGANSDGMSPGLNSEAPSPHVGKN